MTAVTLRRVDPDHNMCRFYRLDVQLDLFGASCLMREWGRIGRAGRVSMTPYATQAEAAAALDQQRAAKERRGYSVPNKTTQVQVDYDEIDVSKDGRNCRHHML